MTPALQQELVKLSLRALLGALLGFMFGQFLLGAFVGVALYLLMHLRYLSVLRRWFVSPKTTELPEPSGLWGEVFDKLLTLQRRNRKRKKKLSAMLAQFQASTEALPDGAVVLGLHGEILWFNNAAKDLLGLRSQDMGQRLANLVRHPAFIDYFSAEQYEGEVEAPSPIRAHQSLAYRIVPYGNNQRLLITRDISSVKRLDAVRKDFVSNASHELRTPLTVLKGWLEMMAAESDNGALSPWREPLRQMQAQTTRMHTLVDDLLKLARLEANPTGAGDTLFSASGLVQRIVDEARVLSADQHCISCTVQPSCLLRGEEIEVRSIFTNLVANAVQYTPVGGSITITLAEQDEGLLFTVTDSGIGISDLDLPRLTERFYRVDVARSRASGGTGLGLSIVKHALERHEATLSVESELGRGSCFSCLFPPQRWQTETAISPPVVTL